MSLPNHSAVSQVRMKNARKIVSVSRNQRNFHSSVLKIADSNRFTRFNLFIVKNCRQQCLCRGSV